MDIERALVCRALQTGELMTLVSRGVEPSHFSATPSGEEVAEVFGWAIDHTRRYNVPPSPQMLRERYPKWRGEPSEDPLEALIDTFLALVKRRAFSAKVIELSKLESNAALWPQLDEIMLDAARDLAAIVPSGRVARFSDMHQRIATYEKEKAEGSHMGLRMGIPAYDGVTMGMQPGDLVTVAGFSGRGKSLAAAWITMNTLEQEATGLMLNLEMNHRQIFERLDTMVTHFSHKLLRQRELDDRDLEVWRSIARQFASAKNDLIVVDRMMGCTVDRVYAEINRYRPDITVVDFVQLMKPSRRTAAQWEALVDIVNDLKSIALATDSVILMVSQDGRGSAKDGSTEENMGGSVSIYQASDIYLGLYQNEEMYERHEMEMRLLKNRSGQREQKALLHWHPETMEFDPKDGADQVSEKHEARNFLRAVA